MYPALNSQTGSAAEAWKAVVLYADAQSGVNAQQVLSRVARQTHSGDSWQTSFWRFDVMSDQPVADMALHDAQDAQMVFLSAQFIHEAPHWLLDWLSAWAGERKGKSSAIAALCQHPPEKNEKTATEMLREFARKHHLTFLCAADFTLRPQE